MVNGSSIEGAIPPSNREENIKYAVLRIGWSQYSIVVYDIDSNNQNGNGNGESGGRPRKRKSQWANDEPKPLLTSLSIQLPDFMKELTDVRDYLVPQSLAPILESLLDEYGDVGAETNLFSRVKMNRRDC
nr:hypothetical protein CFP56_59747 [Quercus suber]